MHTYGFEEKKVAKTRICRICGDEFIALSPRRRYCGKVECKNRKYELKLMRKKAVWQKRKFNNTQNKEGK